MKEYDPKKQSTIMLYLDMNNLYVGAMSEYLPYKELNCLKNVDEFDVMSIDEKRLTGYLTWIECLTWIIQWLSISSRKTWCFNLICCQIVVKKFLINMRLKLVM